MPSPLTKPRELLAIEDVAVRGRRIAVVRFLVESVVDTGEIEDLGSLLYGLVEEHGRILLVVNLGKVQVIASYLLGKLLGLQKRVKIAQGRLVLCEITPAKNPVVDEAFEVCGLKKCFEIYETEAEALQSF